MNYTDGNYGQYAANWGEEHFNNQDILFKLFEDYSIAKNSKSLKWAAQELMKTIDYPADIDSLVTFLDEEYDLITKRVIPYHFVTPGDLVLAQKAIGHSRSKIMRSLCQRIVSSYKRATKFGVRSTFCVAEAIRMLNYCDWCCFYTGAKLQIGLPHSKEYKDQTLSFDHIRAFWNNGDNTVKNVVPANILVNEEKDALSFEAYIELKGLNIADLYRKKSELYRAAITISSM